MLTITDVIQDIENELAKRYEEERNSIIEKLKLNKKPRETVFVCRENGRVYFSKPRKCSDYQEMKVSNYIKYKVEENLKTRLARLEGWRWIAKNCGAVLNKIITGFYITSHMLFFKGGYMHVIGIEEPVIVVIVSELTPEIEELLRILSKCPYRVDVFVGMKIYRPIEAIEALKQKH